MPCRLPRSFKYLSKKISGSRRRCSTKNSSILLENDSHFTCSQLTSAIPKREVKSGCRYQYEMPRLRARLQNVAFKLAQAAE